MHSFAQMDSTVHIRRASKVSQYSESDWAEAQDWKRAKYPLLYTSHSNKMLCLETASTYWKKTRKHHTRFSLC